MTVDLSYLVQLPNQTFSSHLNHQRWSRGHNARGQGTKISEAKAKHSPSEDRPSRGKGQQCSRPRIKDTGASVLQKKRSSKIFFRRPQKNKKKEKGLQKYFSGKLQNFNYSKNSAVLEPRTGQFLRNRVFEAKSKDFKMCPKDVLEAKVVVEDGTSVNN